MKERKLKIIIALMSLALLGLIAVQYYWISNAIKLEEKLFDYKVNDSMIKAVKKISKDESAKYFVHKFIKPGNDNLLVFNGDSIVSGDGVKNWNQKSVIEYKYDSGDSDVVININSDSSKDKSFFIQVTSNDKNTITRRTERSLLTNIQIDSLKMKKEKIVNEVVDDILFFGEKEDIDKRINRKRLDKYLGEELHSNGINAGYYFGVKSAKSDSMFFVTVKNEITELNNTQYKTLLFPEEIYKSPDYLLLAFPNRTGYLLGSISSVLAASLLFIMAIIFLYYKTVGILLGQKKISDMKSDLINNISHEFKTPLSTIALASEALKEPLLAKDKPSADKYISMIEDENNRLQNMIESLLNTALIENGEYLLNKCEIDIHNLIEETVERNSIRVKSLSGTIEVFLNAKYSTISADKIHVSNILNNLIDNSIKYSSGNPGIKINTEDDKNGINIFIQDDGIGMDRQQQKKIFETFYRVPTGDIQNTRGYGIGLSYVKRLVEAHGGKISVSTKLKKGSTFKIFLPYAG